MNNLLFGPELIGLATENFSPMTNGWGILILLMDLRVLEMIEKRLQFHL